MTVMRSKFCDSLLSFLAKAIAGEAMDSKSCQCFILLMSKQFLICSADGQAEEKYTANFPYPYMNGVLHVGHGFSLSKVQPAELSQSHLAQYTTTSKIPMLIFVICQ